MKLTAVSLRGVAFWRLDPAGPGRRLPRVIREHPVILVAFVLFLVSWGIEAYMGWRMQTRPMTFGAYLQTWHFLEATMENWEAEFLEMGIFVMLTKHLLPKDGPEPRAANWGAWCWQHALVLALFALFFVSFGLHAYSGWGMYNDEKGAVSLWEYVTGPTFWFQSTQNWQSEFMAVGVMMVLTIYLRERGQKHF